MFVASYLIVTSVPSELQYNFRPVVQPAGNLLSCIRSENNIEK